MNTKKICIVVMALLLSSSKVALLLSSTGVSAPTQTTEALINIAKSLDKLEAIQSSPTTTAVETSVSTPAMIVVLLDKLVALHNSNAVAAAAGVETSISTQAMIADSLDEIADILAAWIDYKKKVRIALIFSSLLLSMLMSQL
jgi:hypothetical protein